MTYEAPVADTLLTLRGAADIDRLRRSGAFPELDEELIASILAESGRFAEKELLPTDAAGDLQPPRLTDDGVVMPQAYKNAYRRWREAGWGELAAPAKGDDRGLPTAVAVAAQEYWQAANISLSLCFLLSQAAIRTLDAHGDASLKEKWLPPLLSGTCSGTMNLTEAQAGSDVGALTATAEPRDDGGWRLRGEKIFISYGEHDLTENILHLTLARLPDAPPGLDGVSLFAVPRRRDGDDGDDGNESGRGADAGAPNGVPNGVHCVGLEDKMGLHGSPTCVLRYGEKEEAVGRLVGKPHGGMAIMFSMMNMARLAVAVQGVAIAERARQLALAYARERRQGQASTTPKGQSAPIVEHPDIRRMLGMMAAATQAGRALCLDAAVTADLADRAEDPREREKAAARLAILTPTAKAWCSDWAVEAASMGIQIHGGTGYIEAAGAARLLRDARILPIYEGTNGIQAIDLTMRRLPGPDGTPSPAMRDELAAIAETAATCRRINDGPFVKIGERLDAACRALSRVAEILAACAKGKNRDDALAGASDFLEMFGGTLGGAYLARAALALRRNADDAAAAAVSAARLYAERRLPHIEALAAAAQAPVDPVPA